MSHQETLPASWYTSAEIFQLERRNVFGASWLYAAHASELKNPGDYFSFEIAGYPLFLVRQQDGSVSGFHNVCRHRAAPLVRTACGAVQNCSFTCSYHGWTYGLDGKLLAAPYFNNDECAEMSLLPINVAQFGELLFVNLAQNAPPFESAFRELIETIESSEYKMQKYQFHSKVMREGAFNWKAWVDGYQECYHCPTTHPAFKRDFALQFYKVDNRDRFSVHSCQRKNESESGGSPGLWLWVYPNLGLPIYEPCFYTLQVNPIAVNKTRLTYTFNFNKTQSETEIAEFLRFVEQVTDEDISICEGVQKNLESGVYHSGVLNGERENGVIYFHSLVRRAVEMGVGETGSSQLTRVR